MGCIEQMIMIRDENLCRRKEILNRLHRDYIEINIYNVIETDPWWSFGYIKNNLGNARKLGIKNAAIKED